MSPSNPSLRHQVIRIYKGKELIPKTHVNMA